MTSRPTRGSAIDIRIDRRPALRTHTARGVAAAWSAVLARPWRWLAAWSALLVVAQVMTEPRWFGSWVFVVRGVHALIGPDPLALYAAHPELQMGPLTFVLSAPFVLLPASMGPAAAAFAMQAAGLLALREVRAMLRPGDAAGDRRWFVNASLTMLAWTLLAVRSGHPDDVLALVGAVVALRLLRSGAILRSALVLALAVDCKPWIAPVALVLVVVPRRQRVAAALVLVGTIAAAWAPFLLDPRSLGAAGFTIAVDPTASIHLLGLAGSRTPPWCRPAQLLVGGLLVAVVARRGRPEAALLIVVVVRLLLDPATHLYYDAGAVLGACLLDTAVLLPVATIFALGGLLLPPTLAPTDPTAQSVVRLVTLLLLGTLAVSGRRRATEEPPRRPRTQSTRWPSVALSG